MRRDSSDEVLLSQYVGRALGIFIGPNTRKCPV
jgi:hypothetical protein